MGLMWEVNEVPFIKHTLFILAHRVYVINSSDYYICLFTHKGRKWDHKGNSVDVSWRHVVNRRVIIKDLEYLRRGLLRDQQHTSEVWWYLNHFSSQWRDSRENKRLFTLSLWLLETSQLQLESLGQNYRLPLSLPTWGSNSSIGSFSCYLLAPGKGGESPPAGREQSQEDQKPGNSYAPLTSSTPFFDLLPFHLSSPLEWLKWQGTHYVNKCVKDSVQQQVVPMPLVVNSLLDRTFDVSRWIVA